MPEHVHLLVGKPEKGDPSKVIQALKRSVSRRLGAKEEGDRAESDAAGICGWGEACAFVAATVL